MAKLHVRHVRYMRPVRIPHRRTRGHNDERPSEICLQPKQLTYPIIASCSSRATEILLTLSNVLAGKFKKKECFGNPPTKHSQTRILNCVQKCQRVTYFMKNG
jgi:hypothetical protein